MTEQVPVPSNDDSKRETATAAPVVKFGFARTGVKRKQEEEPVARGELVTSISGGQLESLNPSAPQGHIVIPLSASLWKNQQPEREQVKPREQQTKEVAAASGDQTREPAPKKFAYGLNVPSANKPPSVVKETTQSTTATSSKSLDEMAVDALMKDVEDLEKADPEDMSLLMKNQVPGIMAITNEHDRYKHDVSMRPEEASSTDYERVPIEMFGQAMLMGMGWKPGETIGMNDRGLKAPLAYVPRAHLKGLGADAMPKAQKEKKYIKPGESREAKPEMVASIGEDGRVRNVVTLDEKLVAVAPKTIGVNAKVTITAGPHVNLRGVIREMDAANQRALVRLGLNQEDVVLPLAHLALSNTAQASKAAAVTTEKSGSGKSSRNDVGWLLPNIRVRIVSKNSFHSGRYYNKKGNIVDVITPTLCVLRLDDGSVVEEVPQSALETVLPKAAGARVVVVNGQHRSRRGTMVERDVDKQRIIVQFDEDMQDLATIKFDDAAELA